MENKTNEAQKSGKKKKFLKGAAYAGAAGTGALGTMAFTTHGKSETKAEINPDEANDIVVETNDTPASHQHGNDNDTIVAELTDEQVAELKEDLRTELRDEIKQELLHDENFIQDVKDEIVADLDPKQEPTSDNPQPEIEVLDYSTVTVPDGSTADIATMKIEGTHVAMIDVDQDNFADVMVVDTNQNQQFDQGDEEQDITGQGVSMHQFCEAAEQRDCELLAGDGEPIENTDSTDFVNDADTTEFLA